MKTKEFKTYLEVASDKIKTVKRDGRLFSEPEQESFLSIYIEIFEQIQFDVEQNDAANFDLTTDDIDLIAWNCASQLM